MHRIRMFLLVVFSLYFAVGLAAPQQQSPAGSADARLEKLKAEAATGVESLKNLTQQMVDSLFSFGETGFQEFETQKYCAGILTKNGFNVVQGVAGMPSSWLATWGSGKPVIAIGSDVDGLLETNQKPATLRHEPFVEGAPGHGEGHNTGIPLSITAAIAVKRIMEREQPAGHDHDLAGDCRGAAGRQGMVRAGRHFQGRGRLLVQPRSVRISASAGAPAGGTGWSQSSTRSRESRRTRPARRGRGEARSTRSC